MKTLKSKYEIVLDRLQTQEKVTVIDEKKKDAIIDTISKELEEYRFNNQRRIIESQKEIAAIILTA